MDAFDRFSLPALRVVCVGSDRCPVYIEALGRFRGLRVEELADDADHAAALATADLCVFAGPLAAFEATIRAALGCRVPLAVCCATAADPGSLERLARAARKRRLPTALLGSLRLLPAFARIRELVSSGVLGEIRGVCLGRRNAEADDAAARLELFRDLDFVSWLAGISSADVHIRCSEDGLARVWAGSDDAGNAAAGDEAPAAGQRHLRVDGMLGTVRGSVVVPPADHGGHVPLTTLEFTHGDRCRELRIPAGESLTPDIVLLLDGLRRGEPWPCLPGLGEAVAAAAAADFFCAEKPGDLKLRE